MRREYFSWERSTTYCRLNTARPSAGQVSSISWSPERPAWSSTSPVCSESLSVSPTERRTWWTGWTLPSGRSDVPAELALGTRPTRWEVVEVFNWNCCLQEKDIPVCDIRQDVKQDGKLLTDQLSSPRLALLEKLVWSCIFHNYLIFPEGEINITLCLVSFHGKN